MDEADPLYLKALELDPKIHDTHANAGNVYGRHGQYDRAIAEFAEALRINPDFAPAYFGWGVVLEEQKNPDEAIEKFRQAIAKSPHYWGANFRLGQLLEQRGERVEAIERYRQALAANPEFAPARFRLGALLSELGQYDEALGNLFAAVQLDPMNHEAWDGVWQRATCNWPRSGRTTIIRASTHDPPGIRAGCRWGAASPSGKRSLTPTGLSASRAPDGLPGQSLRRCSAGSVRAGLEPPVTWPLSERAPVEIGPAHRAIRRDIRRFVSHRRNIHSAANQISSSAALCRRYCAPSNGTMTVETSRQSA
jgi:tetratricopeptide (TPR) repeat protein